MSVTCGWSWCKLRFVSAKIAKVSDIANLNQNFVFHMMQSEHLPSRTAGSYGYATALPVR